MGASGVSEEPSRIEEDLFRQAVRVPDEVALVQPSDARGSRIVSYRELAAAAAGFAGRLREAGVRPGDRVGVYYEKDLRAVVALYGAWAAGAVAVPIHGGLKHHQVEHILGHSGSRAIVVDGKKRRLLPPALTDDRMVLDVELEGDAAAPSGRAEGLDGDRAHAAILYTSGSTGLPKGILLSHANLVAGARIVSGYLELQSDERILSVTPFSFDYGLNQLLTAVRMGARLVLQRSLLPADICRTLVTEEITGFGGVPPLFIQLMDRASPLQTLELPKLRYFTNTGGVFPPDLVKRYRERFPHVRLYLMYGLTEAFRSTYLPYAEVDERPSSMGRAIPETDILVLDEDGNECPPGVAGELVHRGPTVSLGYWRDDEATARVFERDPARPGDEDAFVVRSGDLVKRDEEGYLYFVSRRDQMIKSQGFRISPEEVELILLRSGLVREAIAAGEPHPTAGAQVVAHVVPNEAYTEAGLLAFCQQEMPRYMMPGRVVTHPSFPRTSSGKVDRKQVARAGEG